MGRSLLLDRRSLGWWLASDGEMPFRRNQPGVSFVRSDGDAPAEVISVDLRRANDPTSVPLTRAVGFRLDGKATAVLPAMLAKPSCPSCRSHAITLLADDHLACTGCGGMFDLDVFVAESGHPIALDWAARLEGTWKADEIDVVVAHRPLLLAASGAQANRAGVAVARAVPLRAFAPTELTDKDLVAIGPQPQMKALDLWFNQNVTARGLAELEGYSSLEFLNAGHNTNLGTASAAHIAKVRSLRWLQAEQTPLGDAGLAHLAKLPRLESLVLNATSVTEAGLKALRGHPTLRAVALNGRMITAADLATSS